MEKDFHKCISQFSPKTLAIMKYWHDNPGTFENSQTVALTEKLGKQLLIDHPEIANCFTPITEKLRLLNNSINQNPALREQLQKRQLLTEKIKLSLEAQPNAKLYDILQESQTLYTQAALSGNIGEFRQYNQELSKLKQELTSLEIAENVDSSLVRDVNDCIVSIDKIGNDELGKQNLSNTQAVPKRFLENAFLLAKTTEIFLPNIDANLDELKQEVKDFLKEYREMTERNTEAANKQSDAANRISRSSNNIAIIAIAISILSLLANGIAVIVAHCDSNANTKENNKIIQLLEQINFTGGNK